MGLDLCMPVTARQGISGILAVISLLLAPVPGAAENADLARKNLSESSLEELMSIAVSSVSWKEQKLLQAAAAVYVITQEDIRRSGATSPTGELNPEETSSSLRGVPSGFDVSNTNRLV
jgi:iron complex outermembrane receptor protein